MTDILEIYRRYHVPYVTSGDRHTSRGWANTYCPFCTGSTGYHLGVHLTELWWNCWRCGRHGAIDTIAALCHLSKQQAKEVYHSLARIPTSTVRLARDQKTQAKVSINRYRRPSYVSKMSRNHLHYLESRGFDPEEIAFEWGVLGTGPISHLDNIDLRNRLFIPIYWEGKEVSFQCRDITGRAELKYITCPERREAVHHKHILYGIQERWQNVGIAVEGVTDCWRLGTAAFALFGIQYKAEQIIEIKKHFKRVMVVFDPEKTANRQAEKLVWQLRALGMQSELITIPAGNDPGSMNQDDADHLVRELLG